MLRLHPDLAPDEKRIGPIDGFIRLVSAMSSPYREWTMPALAAELDLSVAQVRGALHTAWAHGWVQPIQDDPTGTRIDRWVLSPNLPNLAHRWGLALREQAAGLRADFDAIWTTE